MLFHLMSLERLFQEGLYMPHQTAKGSIIHIMACIREREREKASEPNGKKE
jgi:hypothetical protein